MTEELKHRLFCRFAKLYSHELLILRVVCAMDLPEDRFHSWRRTLHPDYEIYRLAFALPLIYDNFDYEKFIDIILQDHPGDKIINEINDIYKGVSKRYINIVIGDNGWGDDEGYLGDEKARAYDVAIVGDIDIEKIQTYYDKAVSELGLFDIQAHYNMHDSLWGEDMYDRIEAQLYKSQGLRIGGSKSHVMIFLETYCAIVNEGIKLFGHDGRLIIGPHLPQINIGGGTLMYGRARW